MPSAGLPGAQGDDQVTKAPPVTLVCCGVIGTTVSDTAAQLAFDRSYGAASGRTGGAAVPGAELALDKLRGSGVRVCLISGFSKKVFASVLDALGWWDKIDLAVSPDETPRGAPAPDLVLTAMLRLGVDDVRETAVAMSTEAGVKAGRRAGAGVVAGVLTGTVPDGRLRRAGASHILGSVADLPHLLTATGPAEGLAGR